MSELDRRVRELERRAAELETKWRGMAVAGSLLGSFVVGVAVLVTVGVITP